MTIYEKCTERKANSRAFEEINEAWSSTMLHTLNKLFQILLLKITKFAAQVRMGSVPKPKSADVDFRAYETEAVAKR
jgi:hypothetical protein